jgi:phosphotransferase system enzyme I (PtsI)
MPRRARASASAAKWRVTPAITRLLLGLGLRSFSMHPAQILAVKQEVLRADTQRLVPWARQVLEAEDPAQAMAA